MTITQAPLTAAAFNSTRPYGAANPIFSGILSGIVNGDDILATYDSLATSETDVGLYPITPSLYDPDGKLSNYSVTLSNGTLIVTQTPLSVTAANISRPLGAANPSLTGTIAGIQNDDNITAVYSTTATVQSAIGTYPITPELADPNNLLGNYIVTSTDGTLTVTQATPAIAWSQPSAIFAGVPLDDTQLNASASDPNTSAALTGTFVYTPAAGTVLAPGLGQSLSVTFAPDDSVDYTSATASVTIDVNDAIPVSITSAGTASGQIAVSFTYTITASGSAPMMFGATGLPPGLSFNVDTISGMPTATGVFDVVLSVSNYANTATQALKIVVTSGTGVNHPPVFSSPPKASSNPATTGISITFTASATDADGDALDYTWDFGDGTSGLGASVAKTYSVAGVYVVNVVVSDGQASAMQSLNLIVEDAPPAGMFAVKKVNIDFNFLKGSDDSLSISGSIPLPAGFSPAGKSVQILIGGLDRTYTLTAKGASADKSFNVKGKPGTQGTFTYELKKQALFALLADLGFSQTMSNPSLIFPVVLALNGTSYLDQPAIKYAAKGNKKGPVSGLGKK